MLGLLLLGCLLGWDPATGIREDCLHTWHADSDADGFGDPDQTIALCDEPEGYVLNAEDCDDGDPKVHPEALDLCEEDRDCDGLVATGDTEDCFTVYEDADADGFGGDESCRCSEEGFSTTPGDCDDTDDTVHPDAQEVWYDGVDQDCDAASDFDADADGYDEDQDCDDTDGTVNPSADELCGDGQDNDCDGVASDGCLFVGELDLQSLTPVQGTESSGELGEVLRFEEWTEGTNLMWVDEKADTDRSGVRFVTAGASLSSPQDGTLTGLVPQGGQLDFVVGDFVKDGEPDLVVGVADGSGALYLFEGPVTAGAERLQPTVAGDILGLGADLQAGHFESVDYTTLLAQNSQGTELWDLGAAPSQLAILNFDPVKVTVAADLNGDGLDDAVLGGWDSGLPNGAIHVVFGPITADHQLPEDADWSWTDTSDRRVGDALAVGDSDGDGSPDVLVGVWSEGAGAAVLLHDPLGDGPVSLLEGANLGDELGRTVALEDLDGDGAADALVQAAGEDSGASNAGTLYVFAVSDEGAFETDDATWTVLGAFKEDRAGESVAFGVLDGHNTLVIGAPGYDGIEANSGAMYLIERDGL